jgi:hypothetical protein
MVQQEPISLLSSRQTDVLYFICGEDLFYRMHKTHYNVGHAGRSRIMYELMNYFLSPNIRQLQIKATTIFLLYLEKKKTWKI